MTQTTTRRRGRRGSSREDRRAARAHPKVESIPYVTRNIPVYEPLGEEGLSIIENNAETILQEVGIEFRDDEDALARWREAGADVSETRVRFPRGCCPIPELVNSKAWNCKFENAISRKRHGAP